MQRITAPYYLLLVLVVVFAPTTAYPASSQMGADIYHQFCSVCHGPRGAGDGPVADALRVKPRDLTQLARKSGGKFPELRVMNFIRGDGEIAAHGTRQMPMWGRVFLDDSGGRPEIVQMRVYSVLKYLEQLQVK